MIAAATRDTDFWLLLGILVLAALVLAYWIPRVLGFILILPVRAIAKARERGQGEPRDDDDVAGHALGVE